MPSAVAVGDPIILRTVHSLPYKGPDTWFYRYGSRSYVPGHMPYVFQAHMPPLSREPCCMAYPSFGAGSDHYGWSRLGAGRVDSGGSPRRCGLVFSVGQTLVRNRAQRRYAPYFRGWRRRRKQRRVAGKVAEGQYMGNPLPQKAGDVALPYMPCAGNIFLKAVF